MFFGNTGETLNMFPPYSDGVVEIETDFGVENLGIPHVMKAVDKLPCGGHGWKNIHFCLHSKLH